MAEVKRLVANTQKGLDITDLQGEKKLSHEVTKFSSGLTWRKAWSFHMFGGCIGNRSLYFLGYMLGMGVYSGRCLLLPADLRPFLWFPTWIGRVQEENFNSAVTLENFFVLLFVSFCLGATPSCAHVLPRLCVQASFPYSLRDHVPCCPGVELVSQDARQVPKSLCYLSCPENSFIIGLFI